MKIILVMFFCLSLIGCGNSYVPFQRIDYDYEKHKFVIVTDFSKDYLKNMIHILLIHKEPFRVKNGTLYITRKLWRNKNALGNYSNNADNDEWVEETSGNYKRYRIMADFLFTDFNMQIDVKIDPVMDRAAYNRYMRELERYLKSMD